MTKPLDLVGKQFCRLSVISREPSNKHGQSMWKCKCVCGNYVIVQGHDLVSGHTTSCGCYSKEVSGKIGSKLLTKHGIKRDYPDLYNVYRGMIRRCYDPSDKSYRNYGARGIGVCDEWRQSIQSFVKWCLDNGYSRELEIDRANNELGYSPDNCRFVTRQENNNNRRCTLRFYNGVSVAHACRMVGIDTTRIKDGRQVSSLEYLKIISMWNYSQKLHPIFIDACVNKHICPHKFLLREV